MGQEKKFMMECWEQDKEELKELQEEIQRMPEVKDIITKLESEIEYKGEELQELQKELQEDNTEKEEITSQIKITIDELQELQDQLEDAKVEFEDLQEKAPRVEELKESVRKGPFYRL